VDKNIPVCFIDWPNLLEQCEELFICHSHWDFGDINSGSLEFLLVLIKRLRAVVRPALDKPSIEEMVCLADLVVSILVLKLYNSISSANTIGFKF
jgi:hypothetical protein